MNLLDHQGDLRRGGTPRSVLSKRVSSELQFLNGGRGKILPLTLHGFSSWLKIPFELKICGESLKGEKRLRTIVTEAR
jgi:hypothetical protein